MRTTLRQSVKATHLGEALDATVHRGNANPCDDTEV